MVVSWLIFIAVALLIYAGFVKLAARLLRYSVSWKVSFLFAGIMMVAVIFHHVLLFRYVMSARSTILVGAEYITCRAGASPASRAWQPERLPYSCLGRLIAETDRDAEWI